MLAQEEFDRPLSHLRKWETTISAQGETAWGRVFHGASQIHPPARAAWRNIDRQFSVYGTLATCARY